jgi:eukaryotic-like serine/threonine-protein kinase
MGAALPETSSRLGPYELLFPIGSGGMATVYLAQHTERTGTLYALKLTHPHLRARLERARELVAEARIATRIRHPNVAQVFHADEATGGVYLVMDYVEGDSLAGLARSLEAAGEKMPLPIGLGIVCGALEGLHAAHELRGDDGAPLAIVHRDFSPHNILVGVDGVARLTDFGIAKSRDNDAVTESGVVKGKFGYMAPEQLRGRSLDRRVDIWAAGVVAWEICTGERLFGAGDHASMMLRLVTEKPRRAKAVAPELPSALDDALAQALELDARRRWATARELGAAIRAAAPIADRSEIGAFVRRVARGQLGARATSIAEAMRRRTTSGVRASSSSRGWLLPAVLLPIVAASAAAAAVVVVKRAPAVVAAPPIASSSPAPEIPSAPAILEPPPAPVTSASASAPASAPARPRTAPRAKGASTKSSTSGGALLDNPYKNE